MLRAFSSALSSLSTTTFKPGGNWPEISYGSFTAFPIRTPPDSCMSTAVSISLFRIPRLHLEPHRRALESKRIANLVFKEALESEMQLDVAVREQHKRGRRHRGLRHVEN